MFRDLQSLESICKIHHTKTTNWQSGPKLYWLVEDSMRPGRVNLSPAWFAQGDEAKHHLLKVSPDLQNDVVLEWLCKCQLPFALISGMPSIMQLELFKSGQEAFRQLLADPKANDNPNHLVEVLEIWYAQFSALLAVISNQSTPLHHNVGGRPEWLDFILALGNYDHG